MSKENQIVRIETLEDRVKFLETTLMKLVDVIQKIESNNSKTQAILSKLVDINAFKKGL